MAFFDFVIAVSKFDFPKPRDASLPTQNTGSVCVKSSLLPSCCALMPSL